MSLTLKTKVIDHFVLVIDKEDGTSPITWKLSYPYSALVLIEDAINLNIKKLENWKSVSSGKHFPVIVWGGLHKYNPEVTLDDVKEVLNPAYQESLEDAIFRLLFPAYVEAFEKSLNEGQSPNSQAVTLKS